MYTLKPVIFSIATLLAGSAALAALSSATAEEQAQGLARTRAIDGFLADSRRYFDL